jgi:hypothetical protein
MDRRYESKSTETFSGRNICCDKNRNYFNFFSEPQAIDFTSLSSSGNDASNAFDLTNDAIRVQYLGLTNATHSIIINVNSISAATSAIIDVYQNGNFVQSLPFIGTGALSAIIVQDTIGLDSTYNFKIRTSTATTVNVSVVYTISAIVSGVFIPYAICSATCSSNAMLVLTDLASMSPIMKISEFFSGILKVFNMTCYGTNLNTYQIEPLDDWYSQGAIVDISQYTDVNSIDIDRMKLYKKVSMKYQDSESFLNRQFSQLFNREYGDTTYQYNYDGDEFTLDVPFENLLQTKFTGTNLQVGYSLNNEFAPYVPKPILLYQYDNKDADFKFNDGSSTSTITNYTPFGQDLKTNLTDYTLNFAPDISTMLNVPIKQTLFGTYYFSYLYNLYNLKQRLINVKTILPISLLTGLRLNDRLVIRDKRYIINSMQSNLTTGEVDFQLVLDFRPMVNNTIQPYIGIAGGVVSFAVNFVNNASTALITGSGVTISPSTITSSQIVAITVPSAAAGTAYEISTRFTLNNGDTETQTAYIIQK